MYLEINGARHTCSQRITKKDTIKFLSVTPAVEDITGTAKLYRDDGFLLAEDNLDAYERKSMAGTCLVVTNAPEPTPVDPTTTNAYRIAALEAETASLREQLAETDEAAIELYEASMAQEAVNAEQDEAIIEIYEAMEGIING